MENIDIELYKTRPEIIRQTVLQVVKDFSMFGIDVSFTGNTEMAYNELFFQLSNHIQRLLENDFGKLSALLYQVDISERKIFDSIADHPEYTHAEVLTELVIHRELKKVLIRNYFKNQKSGQ
ncbi:MAG: hypothetical protein HXX13_18110 [Bacteroidetes bacterium]|nr:hypothetical protein [Bacteroidota bacterium]